MMSLLIFVSAIVVSLVLARQERRQARELEVECRRYGVEPPRFHPRVGRFEGWLNISVGVLLTVASVWIVALLLRSSGPPTEPDEVQLWALFIATGLALIVVGVRNIRRSRSLS